MKRNVEKDEDFDFPERFVDEIFSGIKAPKGFVEDDLRRYRECLGRETMLEQLNACFYFYEKGENFVKTSKDGKLWGGGTGDIQVDIYEDKDEVEVMVYKLEKKWVMKK